MDKTLVNALVYRLDKQAGFIGNELESQNEVNKGVGEVLASPVWAAGRAANPTYLANTTGKAIKYGAGGAAIGSGIGGVAGFMGSEGMTPAQRLMITLLAMGVGGVGGAVVGAGTGAAVHNPWRTYRKKRLQKVIT